MTPTARLPFRLLPLLLFLLPMLGHAQAFLAIDHKTRLKRIRVYPGDELGIRMRGDRGYFKYTLEGLRNDTLFVSFAQGQRKEAIPISSIIRVRWYRPNRGGLAPMVGTLLQMGGAGLIAVRSVNALTQDITPVVPVEMAVGAAAAIGTGWLINRSQQRTFKVSPNQQWELRVMDLGFEPAEKRRR